MPKYVFEVGVTLGAGCAFTPEMCRSVELQLRDGVVLMLMMDGGLGPYEVETSKPFEQVTVTKMGKLRSIDLRPGPRRACSTRTPQ